MNHQSTHAGDALREAAECLDALASADIELTDITLHENGLLVGEGLSADLTVKVPLLPTTASHEVTVAETDAVTVDEAGTLHLPLTVEIPAETKPDTDGSGMASDQEPLPTIATGSQDMSAGLQLRGTADNGRATNGDGPTSNGTAASAGDHGTPDADYAPETEADQADKSTHLDQKATDTDVNETADKSETTAGSAETVDDPEPTDTETDKRESAEPAYRDPGRLQAVYDQYDTFREMTEALGVDVTPQTVRRHMIDHGIHEPSPRDLIGAEATAESAESTSSSGGKSIDEDGGLDANVELPAGVTVTDLAQAIQRSRTIQETSHQLDLDKDVTRDLLTELDVLDLVLGRITTNGEQDVSMEDIKERIQAAASGP